MANHHQQSRTDGSGKGRSTSSRGKAAQGRGGRDSTTLSQGADNYGSSDADESGDVSRDQYEMRRGGMEGMSNSDRELDFETDFQAASRDPRHNGGRGGQDRGWDNGRQDQGGRNGGRQDYDAQGYGRQGWGGNRDGYQDQGRSGGQRYEGNQDGYDRSWNGNGRGRNPSEQGEERAMNSNSGREGYGSSGWEQEARWESDRSSGRGMAGGYEGEHEAMGSARSSDGPAKRGGQHAGKGPKGYKRSDERIHEDVSDRLMRHGGVDASDVEVGVENGEVTLNGTVPDRDMRWRAEECIGECAGVNHVQNNLRWNQNGSGDSSDMSTQGNARGATKGKASQSTASRGSQKGRSSTRH